MSNMLETLQRLIEFFTLNKKGKTMQKILLLIVLFSSLQMGAVCNKQNKQHKDPNIVQCLYNQEDIYRCYSKKLDCYGTAERCKECFFCGCPIEEHTKKEVPIREKYVKKPVIRSTIKKK